MINFLTQITTRNANGGWDTTGYHSTLWFLSNPLDPENPSNNFLDFGNPSYPATQIPVKLKQPSFNRKLSDSVNGIFLNQSFSIALANNDGYFDNDGKNYENFPFINYFGGEVRLYKTNKIKPLFSDFVLIAKGKVRNIKTSFNEFILEIADDLKSMDNNFTQPVSELNINFPFAAVPNQLFFGGGMIDATLKQNAPYVYGTALIEVKQIAHYALIPYTYWSSDNTYSFDVFYLAEGIKEILAFYNSNGEKIEITQDRPDRVGNWEGRMRGLVILDSRLNMCTIPRIFKAPPFEYLPVDENIVPAYALVKGSVSNIGEIIKDILYNKQGIAYNSDNFNIQEYNLFINQTHDVSIIINSGSVKKAVEGILKNDNAFFIQQPDGKFTIRKYNLDYNIKTINSKNITKINNKSYDNFDNNYANTVLVRYDLQINPALPRLLEEKTGFITIENRYANNLYKKENTRTFDTQIIDENTARSFGQNIINRISYAKILLNISIGDDVSDYNLLDTINLNLTDINKRNFSRITKWKIKEINYAQDILVLEEIIN